MPEIAAQDLATLNDLIAGHVRAGLPLEPGLKAAAADWPGRSGSLLRDLTECLERGDDLESALLRFADRLPPEYVSLVRAGQSSGRLPDVLDELTSMASLRVEARRLAVVSFVYPALVALAALGMGLALWVNLLPAFYDDLVDARVPISPTIRWIAESGRTAGRFLTPVVLALMAGGLTLAFLGFVFRVGRWAEFHTRSIPFVGQGWRDFRLAYWTRLVALMMEHGTPEPEAIDLAAQSLESESLKRHAGALAATIRNGGRLSSEDWKAAGVPALAAWAVSWNGSLPSRVATLRTVSDTYARRARRHLTLASRLLPLCMLLAVGGLFTLAYGLLVFLPLSGLYEGLGGGS